MIDTLIAIAALVFFGWLLAPPAQGHRITHTSRGLEMKARNGRLVHVRETESEVEL